jgi:hypothetical protein
VNRVAEHAPDEPPTEIGEGIFRWTNVGPDGRPQQPQLVRWLLVCVGAAVGFALGLIAFFVIAAVTGVGSGPHVAAWFVRSLGLGALAGICVVLPFALRPPRRIALYVGRAGCARIDGGKRHVLRFSEVEQLRERFTVMGTRGMRSTARELIVARDGKERLWFVSPPEPADPGSEFITAVLAAYAACRGGNGTDLYTTT